MARSESMPTPLALVLCESVYEDRGGKRALVGLFNRIVSPTFPVRHPRIAAFVSIEGLPPGTNCKLDVVRAATGEPVASTEGRLPDGSPATVCDLVFELCNLEFREPATYDVRFWANDRLVAQRAIEVARSVEPGRK